MTPALNEVLESTVASLGLELVDVELSDRGRMLRLFIDRPGALPNDPLAGVTVDDCERVSRQLQQVLPVEGVEYERLEVSSPGLDRVVRHARDFIKFVGLQVDARLRLPIDGRRRFIGRIASSTARTVTLEGVGQVHIFALTDIERARLVPQIDIGRKPALAKKPAGKRANGKKVTSETRVDGVSRGPSASRRN